MLPITLRGSAFFLLSILFLAGCSSSTSEPEPVVPPEPVDSICLDLDDIRARGKLVALTDNSSTSYYIYRGNPMGFEYELLEQYCKYLGVELEMQVVNDLDIIFDPLLADSAHIVAANMTVTGERAQSVNFTLPHMKTRQVLVQKLPEGWHKLSRAKLDKMLVREPIELAGKTVHVRKNSSFYPRLQALSDETGANITIVPVSGATETETLIAQVADGTIEYTVADEHVARLNKKYHPGIDVKTPISLDQHIAWAVNPCSEELLTSLNHWIDSVKPSSDYATIYTKYFKARTQQKMRATSAFSSVASGNISEYDALLKAASDTLHWDWRLLASMIFHESGFDPQATAWTGASGLMQVLPSTAADYGVDSLFDPAENIHAGVSFLAYLDNFWSERIEDADQRTRFVLASYNVGLGHILDARQLARKHNSDPAVWEASVERFLAGKAKPEYYNDPVVKHGYCRGSEPVAYVKSVLARYEHYKNAFK